jgi:hypothetical protein
VFLIGSYSLSELEFYCSILSWILEFGAENSEVILKCLPLNVSQHFFREDFCILLCSLILAF